MAKKLPRSLKNKARRAAKPVDAPAPVFEVTTHDTTTNIRVSASFPTFEQALLFFNPANFETIGVIHTQQTKDVDVVLVWRDKAGDARVKVSPEGAAYMTALNGSIIKPLEPVDD